MKEFSITNGAMVATAVALVPAAAHVAEPMQGTGPAPWQAGLALPLFSGLGYGSVAYLQDRLGALRRQPCDTAHEDAALDALRQAKAWPRLCVLVPSHKEELRAIRQTVVSAALAEYPSKRIVVLLDDPRSGPSADHAALQASRQFIEALQARFRDAALGYQQELSAFVARADAGRLDGAIETRRLAGLYEGLADWVSALAEPVGDGARAHGDACSDQAVVAAAAQSHRRHARRLQAGAPLERDALWHEYRRLAALLQLRITAFERKRYGNLSHAPGKAMNLNSYIGLLGCSFREQLGPQGCRLVECEPVQADLIVPEEDLLLTLDAGCLVRHDHLLKLADVMVRDERIAVAQTGLHALLRVRALRDIRQTVSERGFEVPVFIQDATVIEDTGSTLALAATGAAPMPGS
ncbi:hypothetical protein [Azohydromonas caseinilytica]|uniref:Uncharacterized protein n=1 Tax=Azohydromonas caseinilytica TaxID=2728836 RepID=A0A848FC58_9BURK|nr:hypothetical protein [Azohydromonas caseinilytica]NML17787.1 hypothetical protein [Azohydromonas caseinilytica]